MTAVDVSAKIRTTALAVVERGCFGEDFGFDCSLIVLQGQGGRMLVGYNLVTTCRSPLLGQPPLMNIAQVMSADPTAAEVENVVTEAMRRPAGVRRERTQGKRGAAAGACAEPQLDQAAGAGISLVPPFGAKRAAWAWRAAARQPAYRAVVV